MKAIKHATIGISIATLIVATSCGESEDFPNEPIEIMVPYSAGGGIDTATRAFAEALDEELDTQFTIVNREGGGTAVGTTELAGANPDGYETGVATVSTFTSVPLLQEGIQYDEEDFISLVAFADDPFVLLSRSDSDYQTLEDLQEADETLTYATVGLGNTTHLAMGVPLYEMGVDANDVVYNSVQEGLQAVLSGEVDLGSININIAAGQIEAGEVTPLALAAEERHEGLPDLPALAETDWPEGAGYVSSSAWIVPADTPPEVVDTLREAGEAALESDIYQDYMDANYIMESPYSGEEWINEYVPGVYENMQTHIEELGIDPDDS